ncbi:MAG: hypothetical protein HLUCCA11_07005 [Phormidesmis priestleyi Ana]|uniref:Uncharacterized protein n=1 Tax=Phormidesmis priestleyi Ana TaxID=1666911 RepID=A0A0P7ZMM2_9CYAN|nr:MAG: hypothetical protein HLUCCA11_07005 [Phormidesmis priestleyi Ana]
MDRIQIKASELWDLLFSDETAETYQKALNLTGNILKEISQLIWLIICSVFVFGAWFSDTSVRAGKSIREWIDSSGDAASTPTDAQSITDKGKSLLDTGRTGIAYLLNQAREQLGIEPEEMPAVQRTANVIKPAAQPPATPATASPSTSASASTPPTVSAFDRPSPQVSTQPSTQTVGSSRGAGSQSMSSSAAPEVSQEDTDDDWPPQDED